MAPPSLLLLSIPLLLASVLHLRQRHPETLVPVERYARKLREGAAYHGLDREWQSWLGGLETRADTDLPALYLNTPSRRKALAVVGGAALALAAGGWRYAAR